MKALITASFSPDGLRRLGRHMEVVHEDWREQQTIYFDGAKFAARISEVGADVLIVEADLVHEEVLDNCRAAPDRLLPRRSDQRRRRRAPPSSAFRCSSRRAATPTRWPT